MPVARVGRRGLLRTDLPYSEAIGVAALKDMAEMGGACGDGRV